jgi:hypothetical protein
MLVKRIFIATITILFLIAFVTFGSSYIQSWVVKSANTDKMALTLEIDKVNKSIAKVPAPDTQLPLKLAQLEREVKQESNSIPQKMDSTLVINAVLELAQSCNVTVTPIQTVDWSMNDENFRVYTINLQVEGSYEEIVGFTGRLENELFANLIIVNLDISGGLEPDSDTGPDIASLTVSVYAGK